MKRENYVKNMISCLEVLRIYSFVKKTKLYINTSSIVFLFVKIVNNNFKTKVFLFNSAIRPIS